MVFDIIILVFLALAAFAGYRKGLVEMLVSFASLVIAIILAFMLQGTVADMIYNQTSFGNSIEKNIQTTLTEKYEEALEGNEENVIYNSIVDNIANKDEIPEISKEITKFVLKGVSFVAIFLIAFIICYIIRMMLNVVFDLPILSQLNCIGGIVVGIIKAIIKIWILLAVISFLSPLPMFSSIDAMIRESMIANILYSHNLFVTLIKSGLNL